MNQPKSFQYPIVLSFYLFPPVSPIHSLLCYDFSANTTLEEYFKSNRIIFNLDSLIAVAIDLISAIQHLEQKGVVHNNITTSSVLIGRGFRVSLKHQCRASLFCFIALCLRYVCACALGFVGNQPRVPTQEPGKAFKSLYFTSRFFPIFLHTNLHNMLSWLTDSFRGSFRDQLSMWKLSYLFEPNGAIKIP